MRAIRFRIIVAELVAATHVSAFGRWWQASARHRLGKFSGEDANLLNSGGDTPPRLRQDRHTSAGAK